MCNFAVDYKLVKWYYNHANELHRFEDTRTKYTFMNITELICNHSVTHL